jgi:hypothetical protein
MYAGIRAAGPVRSVSLDLTNKCNLRCKGCYYFAEGMDKSHSAGSEAEFDALLDREARRGTNFVTVVGGEPALEPGRLRKIQARFRMNVATNGLIPIPFDGLEQMPIGIAVWGDHQTDARLRSNRDKSLFATSLHNYRHDPRAFWYYTVAPGYAAEIENVVGQCVENGNRVLFNYYSDVSGLGGRLDYRSGFDEVSAEVDRMIGLYPDKVFTTRYLNRVVTSGSLFGEKWGYDVCTNLSTDIEQNASRFDNGNPYNPHFRSYNADFSSTRRCCTGVERDCASCFDTWEHFSWIMINMRKHLVSRESFADWLGATYVFYLVNRLVEFEPGLALLEAFQRRGTHARRPAALAESVA